MEELNDLEEVHPRSMPALLPLAALRLVALVGLLSQSIAQSLPGVRAQADGPTRLVVLGISHSAQLVARSYQPAVFRAFFDHVKPAAICIERDPDNYARRDFYEFTYEQQNIVLPWAEQTHTPVFPVDWVPPGE